MAEVSSTARSLAHRTLLRHAGEQRDARAWGDAADQAYAQLRDRLADLIGMTGYTSLVSRAVRLAQVELQSPEALTFNPQGGDGAYGVHVFVPASVDPEVVAEGLTVVFASIIDLLITFIGEDLALRLVREAWPERASGPTSLE